MSLRRAGCADFDELVSIAEPIARANRVTFPRIAWDGSQLDEWFLSTPYGLEHGFTLTTAPACAGPLSLEIAVSGATVQRRRHEVVSISSDTGGNKYRYGWPFAYDANGRDLPVELQVVSARTMRLVVDTRSAAFPVVVDPLLITEQQKIPEGGSVAVDGDTALIDGNVYDRMAGLWVPSTSLTPSGQVGSNFPTAVALSGDVAVLGDGRATVSGASNAGAVYVFRRTLGAWTEEAKLVAPVALSNQRFGLTADVHGDRIVVGAPNNGNAPRQSFRFSAHQRHLGTGSGAAGHRIRPA